MCFAWSHNLGDPELLHSPFLIIFFVVDKMAFVGYKGSFHPFWVRLSTDNEAVKIFQALPVPVVKKMKLWRLGPTPVSTSLTANDCIRLWQSWEVVFFVAVHKKRDFIAKESSGHIRKPTFLGQARLSCLGAKRLLLFPTTSTLHLASQHHVTFLSGSGFEFSDGFSKGLMS